MSRLWGCQVTPPQLTNMPLSKSMSSSVYKKCHQNLLPTLYPSHFFDKGVTSLKMRRLSQTTLVSTIKAMLAWRFRLNIFVILSHHYQYPTHVHLITSFSSCHWLRYGYLSLSIILIVLCYLRNSWNFCENDLKILIKMFWKRFHNFEI